MYRSSQTAYRYWWVLICKGAIFKRFNISYTTRALTTHTLRLWSIVDRLIRQWSWQAIDWPYLEPHQKMHWQSWSYDNASHDDQLEICNYNQKWSELLNLYLPLSLLCSTTNTLSATIFKILLDNRLSYFKAELSWICSLPSCWYMHSILKQNNTIIIDVMLNHSQCLLSRCKKFSD